jgi:hypothetical protein
VRSVDELADFFDEAAPVSGRFIDYPATIAAFEDLQDLPEVDRMTLVLLSGINVKELQQKFQTLHREPPFSEQWSGLAKALRELPKGLADQPEAVIATDTAGLFDQ